MLRLADPGEPQALWLRAKDTGACGPGSRSMSGLERWLLVPCLNGHAVALQDASLLQLQ